MKRLDDVNMGEYTSFRAGGIAKRMILVDNQEELSAALRELQSQGRDYFFLGNGSDVLFADGGYDGTVLRAGQGFDSIVQKDNLLICGSAVLLSQIAHTAQDLGLSGMEALAGIPGSVGGAVYMNAGAYGRELKDVLHTVNMLSADGRQLYSVPAADMEMGYRTSRIQKTGEIVLSVAIQLERGDPQTIAKAMGEYRARRKEKQPLQYPSAGSFFKRPEGRFAGQLIEEAGLKGLSVGGAQVSEKHAGFIINRGNATATDILELMRLVQRTVQDRTGILLEPEVQIVGKQ